MLRRTHPYILFMGVALAPLCLAASRRPVRIHAHTRARATAHHYPDQVIGAGVVEESTVSVCGGLRVTPTIRIALTTVPKGYHSRELFLVVDPCSALSIEQVGVHIHFRATRITSLESIPAWAGHEILPLPTGGLPTYFAGSEDVCTLSPHLVARSKSTVPPNMPLQPTVTRAPLGASRPAPSRQRPNAGR